MTLIMRLLARDLSGRPQFPRPDSLHSRGIPSGVSRYGLLYCTGIARELYGNCTGIVRELYGKVC